jgi:hypothetical protein
MVNGDQLGAAQGAGEADQQQGAVAQPGEVAAAGGDQGFHLGGGEGGGGAHRLAVQAEDAAHCRPDRGVIGDPGVTVAVVVGDGGEAGLQPALAEAGHQAGEPGGDQDRVDRQGGGIGALGPAPGGETEPVAGVGALGRGGEGVAGGSSVRAPPRASSRPPTRVLATAARQCSALPGSSTLMGGRNAASGPPPSETASSRRICGIASVTRQSGGGRGR